MITNPFELTSPASPDTCVIFASPHSGRDYGSGFLARTTLTKAEIRSSEDAYVDQLFADAPDFGAPLLTARAPRAYIDLNRAATELDPALIEGIHRVAPNPRIASGLGVVPRVVANGRAIYMGKVSLEEAQDRIERVWRPYHDRLQSLLDANLARFERAILVDCHSMPHEAIARAIPAGDDRPEVVLGDRFGASASARVMDRVESAFSNAGFRVARNVPFAGAYIARHYGRPSRKQHVVQIELDRSLYMDEGTLTKHIGFDDIQARLRGVIADIADFGRATQDEIAAE